MSATKRRRASPGPPHAQVLASAARALAAVASQGRSADEALAQFQRSDDRSAIRAITLGSLRWYWRLLPAIEALHGEGRPLAAELRAILIVAAHQIEYSRSLPQSVVNAAVDAARMLGAPRASGLVNAVLRRFVGERAPLLARLDADLGVSTAHPKWLVEAIGRAWPAEAREILEANNAHPPFVLRVNLSRVATEDYLAELAAAGHIGRAVGEWAPAAIALEKPAPVHTLPGFAEGRVSVQDAGAQLAAPLLDAAPGMRVLDACAAPGGKTLHLIERTPALAELVAVDSSPDRLERVEENLQRGGLGAIAARGRIALAARDVREMTAARPFDRILVDAPCSATGVIRRHPDIKLLRRPSDIDSYAARQQEILRATFRMLAPGGRLLYCTCSVLPQENEDRLAAFLAEEPRARPSPAFPAAGLAPGARPRPIGIQLLPGGEAGTDGFYYACIEKTTAGN
ncbi:MAG TPA: 16S rRNA (cytosine(967)-C(5))-methyltransferase RsmB [Steroidobacteraceae bacterium]|nr:16S rRNA (cytosine(967)-C(5))-methyltransferase RsmB [Steroidobacteraceae bacterium]